MVFLAEPLYFIEQKRVYQSPCAKAPQDTLLIYNFAGHPPCVALAKQGGGEDEILRHIAKGAINIELLW